MSPVIAAEERRVKPKSLLAKSGPRRSSRLVVLSADGMRPDFYRRPEKLNLKIPNLRELVQEGASADAVESIYPSITYPAHATLVTGVRPRAHGIYSHLASRDPTEAARAWHWFAKAIRVPTLWDAARAAGLKTAAISWPVSAGASIDYNIPEIWDPTAPDPHRDFQTVAGHSTPALIEKLLGVLGPLIAEVLKPRDKPDRTAATPDRLRAEAAVYLWRHLRPDLLLVHFVYYDQLAHRYGPLAGEALSALEQTDQEIGRLREAVAGDDPVTLIILSDHGFVPVEKEAAPQVILAEEGLFDAPQAGTPKLRRLGAIHAGGSFAIYWLETPQPEERNSLERSVERLCATGAVAEVLDRKKLEALGADPDAELVLDAAPGYYFSDRFEGPVVRPSLKDRGTHGHRPSLPGLEASFIAVGRDIPPGKNLGRIRLTQVAPTLARRLGLPPGTLASEAQPLDLS